jgi:hypothetical protein
MAEIGMPAHAVVPLPEGAGTSIAIVISGHISPKCMVDTGRANEANFGDVLDAKTGHALPATIDMPFGMDCNTPYTATLSSRNGGLLFNGNSVPQFASQINYTAVLGLSQIAGAPSLYCDSQKMHAIGGDSQNSACHANSASWVRRSSGEGHVRLQIVPGGAPLLQGTYSDQLTLRISPTISG